MMLSRVSPPSLSAPGFFGRGRYLSLALGDEQRWSGRSGASRDVRKTLWLVFGGDDSGSVS